MLAMHSKNGLGKTTTGFAGAPPMSGMTASLAPRKMVTRAGVWINFKDTAHMRGHAAWARERQTRQRQVVLITISTLFNNHNKFTNHKSVKLNAELVVCFVKV
jgi:hypothetical protein